MKFLLENTENVENKRAKLSFIWSSLNSTVD